MNGTEFAITPNLSLNALHRVPFDLYRERSEIVASNEGRDTELDVNRARLELLRDLTRSTSSLPINDVLNQATTAEMANPAPGSRLVVQPGMEKPRSPNVGSAFGQDHCSSTILRTPCSYSVCVLTSSRDREH